MYYTQYNAYSAAQLNPMAPPPASPRIDENEFLKRYGTFENILARTNSLLRNNWLAKALLNYHLDFIVGKEGLKPIGGSDRSREIWADWSENICDSTGTKTFYDIQNDIVRGMFVGDVLVYIADDEYAEPGKPRKLIQLISGANVRTPSEFQASGKTDTGNRINLGVEKNGYGREIAYWVRKENVSDESESVKNFVRIPKKDFDTGRTVSILVKNPDTTMIGQARGLSVLTAIITRLEDIATLEETGIEGAISKNMLSVVYLTGQAQNLRPLIQKNADGTNVKIQEPAGQVSNAGTLSKRGIQVLPGQGELRTVNHGGNIDLVALQTAAVKDCCAGVDASYELVMNDFTGVNFSGGKMSVDKAYRKIYRWIKSLSKHLNEIRREVVLSGIEEQNLEPAADDLKVKMWMAPPAPDPQPGVTAQARKTNLETGLQLRAQAVLELTGLDYDTFLEMKAKEEELEKSILGLETVVEEVV